MQLVNYTMEELQRMLTFYECSPRNAQANMTREQVIAEIERRKNNQNFVAN